MGSSAERLNIARNILKVKGGSWGIAPDHVNHLLSAFQQIGFDLQADTLEVAATWKKAKAELLWQRSWRTRRDAEVAIFEYINGFYNPRRCHSTLG